MESAPDKRNPAGAPPGPVSPRGPLAIGAGRGSCAIPKPYGVCNTRRCRRATNPGLADAAVHIPLPRMDIAVEFRELIAALNRAGVEYAVCGGFALAMHGHPRATMDIDIVTTSENVERIKAVAAGLGYTLTGGLFRFEGGRLWVHRVTKIIGEEPCMLDILVPDEGMDFRGIEMSFLGETVPVVTRSALIELKRNAGRPQDLADIEKLEGKP